MGVLERILASKRAEIEALKAEDREPQTMRGGTASVAKVLRRAPGEPLRLLAEIKRKSPSAGALSTALGAPERAEAYARAGATMVSVLVDGPFFGGSWDDLVRVRAQLDRGHRAVPVLAKEFVLDEVQLAMARASGADAVLLIARIVSPARLKELHASARMHDLEPLVEVADETELASALDAGARVIGVNARDLDTLQMDAARAARVIAAIPKDRIALHLSGLKDAAGVKAVAASRADGALLGEALMRHDDPEPLLRELVHAARGEVG